jgi:hypothetical protein
MFAVVFHMNDDKLDQVTNDLLVILRGRSGGMPKRWQIRGKRCDSSPFLLGKHRRPLVQEPIVVVAKLPLTPQCLFPRLFQCSRHQTVFRVDSPISPFRVPCLMACSFHPLLPMFVQLVPVALEILYRSTA